MKMMFQLLTMSTGQRSDMFTGDRKELANKMHELVPVPEQADNAVIVIMEELEEEMCFSCAPILTVENFIQLFGDNHE